MKVYSFPRGGLSLEDPTAPKKNQAVDAFLPALSVICLGNSKKKVNPLVSPGEMVREGMLIGKSSGPGTMNVHATVPGRIIRKLSWKDSCDIDNEALVIRMEGSFEKLGKREEVFSWAGLSGYDLQRIISDYGIVEMENAGRPLSELISGARRLNEKLTLVVRCVFDDPWLVADYALCKERLKEVIEGTAIAAKACINVSRIVFAVSHHEKELGSQLLQEAGSLKFPSALVLTGSRYPQRNGRELELALRTYEKKEGLAHGPFLILGPAALAAAHDAVKYKKPILYRYVAIGGSAVKNPQIMKVRIGTRIGDVIEQCGGFVGKPYRIAIGSPFSGREVKYLYEPVQSTSYAVIAMSKNQTAPHEPQNCINCGECRAVCPIGLDPQYIYKTIKSNKAENEEATNCHGCGCCKVVCPSALPLSETIFERNQEATGA